MLTGDYLFESCLTTEYNRLSTDANYLKEALYSKSPSSFILDSMPEAEMTDLVNLLQGLISYEPESRIGV
jgi:hypothetical protein